MGRRAVLEKFDSTKIAKLLFVINLPLSILSVVVMLVFVIQAAMSNLSSTVINLQFILFGTLLVLGFTAEIVYYMQGRFISYAQSRMSWYYSIAVQVTFISAYLSDFLLHSTSLGVIAFIIYPIFFLVLSIAGLIKTKQLRLSATSA